MTTEEMLHLIGHYIERFDGIEWRPGLLYEITRLGEETWGLKIIERGSGRVGYVWTEGKNWLRKKPEEQKAGDAS